MGVMHELSRELEALVERTAPAVVGVESGRGQGSGLILAQDGYILTNAHVVQGARKWRIQLSGGDSATAERVGTDPATDLAVLRIDGRGLKSLPLADFQSVHVGQLVVAIGNPFEFERSMSLGVISALDRTLPAPRGGILEGLIQTDAAINPGNSGGPLLNADGEVLGVNTAIIPFAQGIGFAVPVTTANWVAAVLIHSGEVRRPYLGISARGEELATALWGRVPQRRAIRVMHVGADSPAALAGLKGGDFLLSANGKELRTVDDLHRVMVLSQPSPLRLEILRNQARKEVLAVPGPALQAA